MSPDNEVANASKHSDENNALDKHKTHEEKKNKKKKNKASPSPKGLF